MTYQVRYTTEDMVYYHVCHSHEMAEAIADSVCKLKEAINVAIVGPTIEMIKKDGKLCERK